MSNNNRLPRLGISGASGRIEVIMHRRNGVETLSAQEARDVAKMLIELADAFDAAGETHTPHLGSFYVSG